MVRYRRSDAVTRQQLMWLALAVGVVTVCWTTANVLEASGTVSDGALIRTLPLLLIAPTCAVALLKYRLYDIDLVIRKLFVYAGLAAFVVTLLISSETTWSSAEEYTARSVLLGRY